MTNLDISSEIREKTLENDSQIKYFQNQYVISIQAILWYFEPLRDWWDFFMVCTKNLATRSIEDELELKSWKNNSNLLVIKDFPNIILWRRKNDIQEVYDNYGIILSKLCEQCEKEWETLILWFSSMWWFELLPKLSEIIRYLKSKYKNLVFIIWWADFNSLPEKDFLDKTFKYWIDIVNIWWANEFTEFFWSLDNDDNFFRDKKWNLQIKTDKQIPENLVFSHQKDNIWNIKQWEKIKTTFYFNEFKHELYFAINNNPCLNNCGYCANHIHDSTPLKDTDIDNAINDYNEYISWIDSNEIRLTIENPNPLQYIDKFERFLQNIDLSKIFELCIFGDFMWMWNDKVYEKVVNLIDNLLSKYPKLSITIHFWIDAIHHKWDWDFVWRTVWLKIAEEPKYTAWFRNFDKFYNKYLHNPRIHIPFNVIFHPNMDLEWYKERADIINKYRWKSNSLWLYSLSPHPNTRIEQDHKWFYIPEHKLIDVVNLINNHWFRNVSLWGHFYLNSKLLDLFVLFQLTWLLEIFDNIIKENINKGTNNIDFIEVCTWLWIKLDIELDKTKLFRNKIFKFKETRLRKESTKKRTEIIINLLEFMIYRENYICSINPDYSTQEVKEFIKELITLKNAFIEFEKEILT